MQITALGHSCLLLDFQGTDSPRILIDPWLSDHATGDAMGRFPRLRFDVRDLGPIHAVFLSHAHSDHLDPYTLVRLWRELPSAPTLILPVTLSFLLPLFREHLDDPDVLVLHPHTATRFRGAELLGFYDVGAEANNEDDVMVLVATHGAERVLVEADARLSLELPNFREFIRALMRKKGLDSAVYLTTENELTGTLESRTCTSLEERADLHAYALEELHQAIEQLYTPVDDDLWRSERVLRLVHGQGLTAPHELDARWQRILFPVRIEDRVRMEREAAARTGCTHQIDGLTVGFVHTIASGRVQHRAPMPGLHLLDHEEDRTYDPELAFFPHLPQGPLRPVPRDVPHQRRRLLELLNTRFLPYLHGLRQPPVLHLLADHGGAYRVRFYYGPGPDAGAWDYVLGFDAWGFVEVPEDYEEVHEAYWANDLEDFLEGRCDEYTPFCRTQLPVAQMRLWACLATPLLNADLVAKRVRLHFERARDGLTPGSFVLPFYAPITG